MKTKKILAVGLILTLILNMFSMVVFAEKVDDTDKEEICLNLDVSDYTLEKMPDKLKNRINRDKIISLDKSDADDVNSLTVINEDGTKTLTVFSQPIKYIEEETGKVQFIDDSLIASNDANAYKCITNSNKLYFPKEISKGISLQKGNNKIKITPVVLETKGNEKVKYKKTKINKKDYLQYDNVFGENTAIQLTPMNAGVKENIVLDKYNGENRFSYIIDAGKLFPRRNEGTTIAFVDPKTDLEVLKINEIFVYDATYKGNNTTKQNTTCDNYYEIEKLNNGKYLLTMVVDDSFLKSSSTTYPVVVDPTMSWEEEQSAIQYGSIPSDDDFQTSENDGINVGYRYGTNWRTWLRIKNFSRFRHINPNLVVDAYASVFVNGNVSSLPINLATSTANKSISSNPNVDECFSSTLETIATRTLTRELNFIELDNIFVKWMKTDKESPSINFVPGFVMYTTADDKYAQIVTNEDLFNPSVCVKFYEDESIKNDIYYIKSKCIKNSKHYLCVDDSGNIKFSKTLPSTHRNYLWRVLKDNSDGSYIIQSCNNIVSNTNLCLYTNNDTIKLGESTENVVQDWRIVNNFDGTHRIISCYENVISSNIRTATVNPEYNKLSASDCNFSEYQSWSFVPYTKDVTSRSVIKSISQWPTAKASSSQNLLHGKVPHSIEYKTDGTFLASGSGVSTPVIRQQATDGSEMSDGSISDYNIDLGRYTLKEYNSADTIKFVNPDGSYRPKGELYVDVTYNLGSTQTFNSIWFATNTNQNYYTVGAFEVYTSNKLSELYFSKNKIAEFDHSDSIWTGIVNIDFRGDHTGKYFGIRITQGVLPQANNGWLNHSIADTYARVRDIVLFKENRKKIKITNYYDEGLLERWNATDEDIKGIIGISAMETYAKNFFENLRYNGQNMGLEISFNDIFKHMSSADLCPTAEGINEDCSCEHTNHKKETTILEKFSNETEYEMLELKIPILWTGHIAINEVGEPVEDGAATYYNYGKHIILLNTGAGSSLDLNFSNFLTSQRIQRAYLHEICHTLGAHDSYCYGVVDGDKCNNERCIKCYEDTGYESSCIMAYGDTSEGDSNSWICNRCKQDIYNYLMGEHK